jgi:hypothetical protein
MSPRSNRAITVSVRRTGPTTLRIVNVETTSDN